MDVVGHDCLPGSGGKTILLILLDSMADGNNCLAANVGAPGTQAGQRKRQSLPLRRNNNADHDMQPNVNGAHRDAEKT
jgi:hypothetical protein